MTEAPTETRSPKTMSEDEITKNDDFELSIYRDLDTNGIVVRMGDAATGRSIVVSGEAVMHAAGIVEKSFEEKKNASVARSLN